MKLKEIIRLMEELAAPDWQESWDKSRLQIGDPEKEIQRILLALDADSLTLQKAEEEGCDLLITHHPLFFHSPEGLRTYVPEEKLLRAFILSGIEVYSAHTNLDAAPWGVNYAFAKKAGLEDALEAEPLLPCKEGVRPASEFKEAAKYRIKKPGFGAVAAAEISRLELLERLKKAFGPALQLNFSEDAPCRKIVFSGGSWDASWNDLLVAREIDAVVCGEMKYHVQIALRERGVASYVPGHGESEKPVLAEVASYLQKQGAPECVLFYGQESRELLES